MNYPTDEIADEKFKNQEKELKSKEEQLCWLEDKQIGQNHITKMSKPTASAPSWLVIELVFC